MKRNALILLSFLTSLLFVTRSYGLNVDESLLTKALTKLDSFETSKSYTSSFFMHNDEAIQGAFLSLKEGELRDFVPLFQEIVELISQEEKRRNQTIMHMAIRVDPNGLLMKNNRERAFTSEWHSHEPDDRYLFVLTRCNSLTTMIKRQNEVEFIPPNTLFLLPGSMIHRTPDPAAGKRIQLSIAITTAFE